MTIEYESIGPASPAERQFWLSEQIAPSSPANRAVVGIRLDGDVDAEALDQALRAVVRRHQALRTAFAFKDRRVVRRVLARPPDMPRLDLSPGADLGVAAPAVTGPGVLEIAEGRVHRVAASADAEGTTVYLGIHHIVFDGISGEIIAADLARAYGAIVDGRTPDLPTKRRPDPQPLDPHHRDRLVGYWRSILDGVPDLPTDGTGPSPRDLFSAGPAEHRQVYTAAVMQAVRDQARAHACSPYAVMLSAYAGALSDLSGAADFCVGTPVSVRSAQQQDEVGCLINIVPIRVREPGERDAVRRIWATVIDGMTYLALPTEDIVNACRPARSRRMPIYQAMFGYLNWPRQVHQAGGTRVRTLPARPLGTLAEIQLQLCELDDGTLEAVVQSPVGGTWAGRLADVAGLFVGRLCGPSAVPGASR